MSQQKWILIAVLLIVHFQKSIYLTTWCSILASTKICPNQVSFLHLPWMTHCGDLFVRFQNLKFFAFKDRSPQVDNIFCTLYSYELVSTWLQLWPCVIKSQCATSGLGELALTPDSSYSIFVTDHTEFWHLLKVKSVIVVICDSN